ncbi:LysR family transcriptional regulator [Haliea sp. E17]|uniref:LysR family transcriptional regulator n=1 Tax=Haliea sp. E17 TaxID=3401576 RepID=UPI003AAE70A5
MSSSRLPARIGTFRQLEILMAIAESGGIAAAADRLHLSQPTVSMQMKKLADNIGAPLYDLSGRRLALTHAGELVLQHAREIFDCTDRLEMALDQLRGMHKGRLSIGIVSSAEYFAPHLLGPFYRRYPSIEVAFNVGNREELSARLKNNLDDLYIFGFPPTDTDVELTELGENHLVVIAPKGHPLATRQRLRWEDIADELFIVREEGAGTRIAVEHHLQRLGYSLRHQLTIASNEGIKHAVLARMGLAIVPSLCLDEGDQRELVQLPVAGFPLLDHWNLVFRRGKTFSVVAETCRQYLLDEGRAMYREATLYWEQHQRPKLPTR